MRHYTVHARPGRPAVLVPEAFAWGAFLFGPLWLLGQRAWLAAIPTGLGLALTLLAPPPLGALLSFGALLLLGLTGRDLVRWNLGWRGYRLAHVVVGRNQDDALLRLLGHDPDLAAPELGR